MEFGLLCSYKPIVNGGLVLALNTCWTLNEQRIAILFLPDLYFTLQLSIKFLNGIRNFNWSKARRLETLASHRKNTIFFLRTHVPIPC